MKMLPTIRLIIILIMCMQPLQSMHDTCDHLNQRPRAGVKKCLCCASQKNPISQNDPLELTATATRQEIIESLRKQLQERIAQEKNVDSLQCLQNLVANLSNSSLQN